MIFSTNLHRDDYSLAFKFAFIVRTIQPVYILRLWQMCSYTQAICENFLAYPDLSW